MNDYVAGSTSVVETIFLQDSASTVGAGKTGLAYNTASLTCYYKRSNGTVAVAVSLANIITLGTFVSGGFKEIDGTNQPGLYEFHPPDAALASGAKHVTFYFVGASGMAPRPIKIRILAVNPDDAMRMGLTALPSANAEANGGIITRGTGTGQLDITSGVVKANLAQILGTALTETAGFIAAGFKQFFNIASPTSTMNQITLIDTVNTGGITATSFAAGAIDADAIATDAIGSNELAASAIAEIQSGLATASALTTAQTDLTTLVGRLTSARAGYLDNLNVGGAVANQADVLAINQSASRRIILTTVTQYERPESGNTVYGIEARTYDGDGAAVNADTDPTLTVTGRITGSLAANLSSITNPATGVYRWTYTVASTATLEEIRVDVSATISASTFTLSAYTQVTDFVSATFTSTDQSHLTTIYNKLPTGNIASPGDTMDLINSPNVTALAAISTKVNTDLTSNHGSGSYTTATGFATAANLTTLQTTATAIKVVTDKLATTLEVDGSNFRYTVAALFNAPSGGGGGSDPLDNEVPGSYEDGTAGKAIADILESTSNIVSSGTVFVNSSLINGRLTIIRGDVYSGSTAVKLEFEDTSWNWSNETLTFLTSKNSISYPLTIVTATKLRLNLTKDQSLTLVHGEQSYSIRVDDAETSSYGDLIVLNRYGRTT